jgi:hypothetical protein
MSGVAERRNLEFPLEFEFMRDVHLVVVILVQFYLVNIE